MQWFDGDLPPVYLHRAPIDFRKSINGLSLVVEHEMALSPLSAALFVFCNRRRDKLKLLHWGQTAPGMRVALRIRVLFNRTPVHSTGKELRSPCVPA